VIKRAAGLLPAAVLILFLAGCGSEEPGGSAESGSTERDSTSETSPETSTGTSTATSSATSSATASSEPAAPEATGEDYRALVAALFEQREVVEGVTTPEEFNKVADFPEGIAVAELDQNAETICLEDANKDIAVTFDSLGLALHAGTCADGEDVATLSPRGQNDLRVTGDKALGEPVRQYFKEEFGGS
jgi:hypothetical protein